MKKKYLALLLATVMTVASVDGTALVSAADFSAEAETEVEMQDEDPVTADEDFADTDTADEETDVEVAGETDTTDENAFAEENADAEETEELFSDAGTANTSKSSLKMGKNSGIMGERKYKFVPDTTGVYYIYGADISEVYDKNFDSYDGLSEHAFLMEKGKTYYVEFDFYVEDAEVTIMLSPKATGFTVESGRKEGLWGESTTRISGICHITAGDGSLSTDYRYYSGERTSSEYDEFGHLVTLEIKDEAGNAVDVETEYLKPGKYSYQIKVDGFTSDVYYYTVKAASGYQQVKEGENNVKLSVREEYDTATGYCQFIPESTGIYDITGSQGEIKDIYYMDENGEYQSCQWLDTGVDKSGCKMEAGKVYYMYIYQNEEWLGGYLGTMTINVTKLADKACEWSDPVVKTPATCGKNGVAVKTCKIHGEKRNVIVFSTGKHKFSWNVEKEATVSATGLKVEKCKVCGVIRDAKTLAKLKPSITLNVTQNKTIPLQIKQSFQTKVSGLAKGDKVVSWTSSNTKTATVKNGKITGKKAGTATITVKLRSGLTAKFKVKVQKAAVATTSLKVVSKATGKTVKSATVKVKKTLALATTVAPVTSGQKVTYSSSNSRVAVINSRGVITGKKKGKVTVTVKSGKKTAKIQITVK